MVGAMRGQGHGQRFSPPSMAAMLVVCRPQRKNAGLAEGVLVDRYCKPVVDASSKSPSGRPRVYICTWFGN
jgi:hypothetical protein